MHGSYAHVTQEMQPTIFEDLAHARRGYMLRACERDGRWVSSWRLQYYKRLLTSRRCIELIQASYKPPQEEAPVSTDGGI